MNNILVEKSNGMSLGQLKVDLTTEIPTIKLLQSTGNNWQSIALGDYTAFEVLPHTTTIPSGSIISETILAENLTDTTVLSSTLLYDIQPKTLHRIKIRTNQPIPTKSDVIIDWGDGTISSIAKQEYESANSKIDTVAKEGDYVFSHDYNQALTNANVTSKRFIIKIYGRQYYNICHKIDSANALVSNLMCRAFEIDLPLASNFKNISNFCFYANNLVFASFEAVKYNYYENAQGLFCGCTNLVKAVGFGAAFTYTTCGSFFSSCKSLTTTDFVLPMNTYRNNSFSLIFNGCFNLNKDISSLFPAVWSMKGTVSASSMFRYCRSLTGTVPDKLLWNNPDITWTSTNTCFLDTPAEIRAQVPASWGGTGSNDLITVQH